MNTQTDERGYGVDNFDLGNQDVRPSGCCITQIVSLFCLLTEISHFCVCYIGSIRSCRNIS
jgi:hypothetical protein